MNSDKFLKLIAIGMGLLLGGIVLLAAMTECYGATYYVKTTGNDGNAGTGTGDAEAWLTMVYGCSQLSAGDTMFVMAGTYSEYRVGSNLADGTSGNEIVIKAYPGAEVWVDGGNRSGGVSSSETTAIWINSNYLIMDSINAKRGFQSAVDLFLARQCTYKNGKVCSTTAASSFASTPYLLEIQDCDTCTIYNCEIFDNLGIVHNNSMGIMIWGDDEASHGSGHIIRKNTVHDCPGGIWYKHGAVVNGWQVDSNIVYNYDRRGICCSQDSAMICYNLIYGGQTDDSWGIQMGEFAGGSQDVRWCQVYNNTINGTGNPGVYWKQTSGGDVIDTIQMWNNIIAHTKKSTGNENELQVWAFSGGLEPDSFYSDYNCFYDSTYTTNLIRWADTQYTVSGFCAAQSHDCNSIQQDPLFVNPVSGNFTLQSGSPCRTGRGGAYENYMGYWNPTSGVVRKVLGKGNFGKMNLQ